MESSKIYHEQLKEYRALFKTIFTNADEVAAYYTDRALLVQALQEQLIELGHGGSFLQNTSQTERSWLSDMVIRCRTIAVYICIYLEVLLKLHEWQNRKGLASEQERILFQSVQITFNETYSKQNAAQVLHLIQKYLNKESGFVFAFRPEAWAKLDAFFKDMKTKTEKMDTEPPNVSIVGKLFKMAFGMLYAFMVPTMSIIPPHATMSDVALHIIQSDLDKVPEWREKISSYNSWMAKKACAYDRELTYERDMRTAFAMVSHSRLGGGSPAAALPQDIIITVTGRI
eukprot:3935237-Rhodomonas_salina.1